MGHLSDERILEIARRGDSGDPSGHTGQCCECADGMRMWRLALEILPAAFDETISDSERLALSLMFRHHRPLR